MDRRAFVRDASAIVGLGLVGYGCWLAWPPLGFIVPGFLLFTFAMVGQFMTNMRRMVRREP